jgi:membrane fusion protein, multidrug efflux system
MGFRRAGWLALLAVVAAAAYGVYAPETADRWAPPFGPVAHQAHAKLWPAKTPVAGGATKPTPVGQGPSPAPIVVSVVPAKRTDFPIVLEGLGQVQAYNTVLGRARVDCQFVKIGVM